MEGNVLLRVSRERINLRAMLINVTIHLSYDNGKEISKNLTI